MATAAGRATPRVSRFDRIVTDRVLAWGALVMLAVVAVAVIRGRAQWAAIPWTVWLHLATMTTALVLTPVLLLQAKGTRRHRLLGWTWATAMLATAVISFMIRATNHGQFSAIHILSVWVVFQVPWIVYRARTHNVAGHRRSVRGMVLGALLVAGFFTLPFDRLLGHWLFA